MTILISEDGNVHAVYNDSLAKVDFGGEKTVRRATEVEFNHKENRWEATCLSTGKIIATGSERAKVIQQEVALLEQKLEAPDGQTNFHCHSRHPSTVEAVQPAGT